MLTRRLAFTAFLASGIATPAKRDVEFGAWRESRVVSTELCKRLADNDSR
jgi:hypothetical protein